MAVDDLRAMRAGEMDASGEQLTRVGMYLGIANVIFVGFIVLSVATVTALTILLN